MSNRLALASSAAGLLPFSSAATLAALQGYSITSQLAASSNATPSILASGSAGTPTAGSYADLYARAQAACASGDRAQCSALNQQLAGGGALAECSGTMHHRNRNAGSVQHFLRMPTWVSNVLPSSQQTNALGLAVTAVQPR